MARGRNKSHGASRSRRPRSGGSGLCIGGPHGVEAALASSMPVHRVYVEDGAGRRVLELAEQARGRSIPVSKMGEGECDRMADVRCQGVAADISYRYAEFDDLVERPGLLLFLDEIADPHNLGALVRTAEAAGAAGVVLPGRRAAGVTATVVRASAGAAVQLPVARTGNLVQALRAAQDAGRWTIGLDGEADRVLEPAEETDRAVLVVGSEGSGLRRLVAESCDEVARLPMVGSVESLNASVAGALAIYRTLEKRLYGVRDS